MRSQFQKIHENLSSGGQIYMQTDGRTDMKKIIGAFGEPRKGTETVLMLFLEIFR